VAADGELTVRLNERGFGMTQFAYRFYYKQDLPHVQPPGATIFVTFRLANSLPEQVIEKFIDENKKLEQKVLNDSQAGNAKDHTEQLHKKQFARFDNLLHFYASSKVCYLKDDRVANLVSESIHYRNNKFYDLIAFCIMPNHVHLLITPLQENVDQYYSLTKILHSLKGHTAFQANKTLNRTGTFWQRESYDHVVRDDEELSRIVAYILFNPVRAKLTSDWQDWPWSYCKYPTPV
jgi:REP element-mobilizing transposase RayT